MYLLDVNVLLAFRYTAQPLHLRAARWVQHVMLSEAEPFATCPIVELGFVRVASGRSGLAETLSAARADLRRLKSDLRARFLGDELDGDQFPEWVTQSKQTTDGHLLALAMRYKVKLATLDERIPGALLIPDFIGSSMVRERVPVYGAAA